MSSWVPMIFLKLNFTFGDDIGNNRLKFLNKRIDRLGEISMCNISVREIGNNIEIYNDGVLIVKETSYTRIVLIIKRLKNVIQDVYQLNVLDEILKISELREVA